MRIIAADFETSGLDPKRNFPVSIGIALMDGGDVVDAYSSIISPPRGKDGKVTREYNVEALMISGITWKQIQEGSPAASVLADLRRFADTHGCHGAPVVAFNAPFDLAFYSELLFASGAWDQHLRRFVGAVPPLYGPWHCARMIAANQVTLENYRLDTVAEHFGFSRTTDTHGALDDAILAGKVFHRLTEKQAVAA